MGYVKGFLHGATVGTVIGLCIAPQPGRRTRKQVSSFAVTAQDTAVKAQDVARRVAPYAQTAFSTVADAAGTIKDRVGHDTDIPAKGAAKSSPESGNGRR